METRSDLDQKISLLPTAISTAVVGAITPVLKPIADTLRAQDYTAEGDQLDKMPDLIATSIKASIASVFGPPSTNGGATTDGGATQAATATVDSGSQPPADAPTKDTLT